MGQRREVVEFTGVGPEGQVGGFFGSHSAGVTRVWNSGTRGEIV